VKKLIHLFRHNERGVSSIEYAMLVIGIGLAILAGAKMLGNDVNSGLTATGNAITNNL
jgi:Flp pilus assembly pilin Flp